jgi:hypothetical protein
MELDKLLELIRDFLAINHGRLTSGARISHNPDVCHDATTWFIHAVRSKGAAFAIAELSIRDKKYAVESQKHMDRGPGMSAAIRKIAGAGGSIPATSTALGTIRDFHSQPAVGDYSPDTTMVGATVIEELARTGCLMIYMTGDGGHVMCAISYVGGVLIYDPNIGVMSLPAGKREELKLLIIMILNWYKIELKLTKFSLKAK